MNADEFLSQDLQKMEGGLVASHMLSENQTDNPVPKEIMDLNGGGSTILGENPSSEVSLYFRVIMYEVISSLLIFIFSHVFVCVSGCKEQARGLD
jgi:hypothetical protein